jgi:hypothetical protein
MTFKHLSISFFVFINDIQLYTYCLQKVIGRIEAKMFCYVLARIANVLKMRQFLRETKRLVKMARFIASTRNF